jgi:CBS domain-containing protein
MPPAPSWAEVRALLRAAPRGVFFVVDGEDRLCGALTLDDLGDIVFGDGDESPVDAAALARVNDTAVLADDSVERTLAVMDERGVEQLPVVDDAKTRRVVGVVRRAAILAVHNRALVAAGAERGG